MQDPIKASFVVHPGEVNLNSHVLVARSSSGGYGGKAVRALMGLADWTAFALVWFLLSLLQGFWMSWRTVVRVARGNVRMQPPAVGGDGWYATRLRTATASLTTSGMSWLGSARWLIARFVWLLMLCSVMLIAMALMGLVAALLSRPRNL